MENQAALTALAMKELERSIEQQKMSHSWVSGKGPVTEVTAAKPQEEEVHQEEVAAVPE